MSDRIADGILAYLERYGPQDRASLVRIAGVPDRRMRRAVEWLRQRGELVIHDGDLYRIAQSAEEYEAWERHEVNSRLGSFFIQRKAMRESVARRWPHQMRLDEVA